ncbi:hypothetical protein GCM10009424_10070 [Sphingomonas ursincola]
MVQGLAWRAARPIQQNTASCGISNILGPSDDLPRPQMTGDSLAQRRQTDGSKSRRIVQKLLQNWG